MSEDRHSRSVAEPLITDKLERAKRESENGLRQIDLVLERAGRHIGPNAEPFKLRPSLLLMLNRAAVEGIEATAGAFRTGRMEIFGSKHKPPIGAEVPELIEELCDYVNDRWSTASAAHLAAYVMWRINWIHPFDDGNGRTARAASYLVLLAKTGSVLPRQRIGSEAACLTGPSVARVICLLTKPPPSPRPARSGSGGRRPTARPWRPRPWR